MTFANIKLCVFLALSCSIAACGQAQASTLPNQFSAAIAKAVIESKAELITSEKTKQQSGSGLAPEQVRKMLEASPYGYAIMTYWIDGDKSLKTGQFNDAIEQFQKALAASKVWRKPRFTVEQNLLVRQCAIAGSEASLVGAIAARDYYKKNNRKMSAIDEALKIYQRERKSSWDRAIAENPRLESGCP
jgi:hypothetical protein